MRRLPLARPHRPDAAGAGAGINRDGFFAALMLLAAGNGLAGAMAEAVRWHGWTSALASTFNISVIVYSACAAGAWLILRARRDDEAVSRRDGIVGVMVLLAALFPLGKASFVALTGLGLYVLAASRPGSDRRRAAVIFIAVTVPMLWGPLLLNTIGRPLLWADAMAVASLIGTARLGNTVQFADGSGAFEIYPGCSSLHGISLAFLTWVTVSQLIGRRFRPADIGWCLAAAAGVVAVNAGRLGLIGLYRDHFDTLHGPPGNAVAGWLSLAVIAAVSIAGLRRELLAAA